MPQDPEDETGMQKKSAEEQYSAVKSLMHAIGTDDHDTQQDAIHQMI